MIFTGGEITKVLPMNLFYPVKGFGMAEVIFLKLLVFQVFL